MALVGGRAGGRKRSTSCKATRRRDRRWQVVGTSSWIQTDSIYRRTPSAPKSKKGLLWSVTDMYPKPRQRGGGRASRSRSASSAEIRDVSVRYRLHLVKRISVTKLAVTTNVAMQSTRSFFLLKRRTGCSALLDQHGDDDYSDVNRKLSLASQLNIVIYLSRID